MTLSEPGMTLRLAKVCSPETFLPWRGIMWSTWCSMPDALVSIAASWYLAIIRCAFGSHFGVRCSWEALRLHSNAAFTGLLFLFHSRFLALCASKSFSRFFRCAACFFSGFAKAQRRDRSMVSALLRSYHSFANCFWFSLSFAIHI